MNVPVALADLALEVPPEGGRALTPEEKRSFLLEGWDPGADEERVGALARRYGLTSGEYRLRWHATVETCGTEALLERRIVTHQLDPRHAGFPLAEEMRTAWNECRWKAMGDPEPQGSHE
jgi:hypothetical protein